jgi:KDO2-lipid IV(A) lauroyltransferase
MFILHYLILGIIYLFSLLPLWFLYRISDLSYVILYKVFKYRIHITRKNLKAGLPNLSEGELLRIEKQFYRHLGDVLVETIKSFSISKKELLRRMKIENAEILDKHLRAEKSLIAVTGHYGNWEWAAMSLALQVNYPAYGLYLPLKNKVFNASMVRSRSRFGVRLVAVKELADKMEELKNKTCIWGFIVDQSPAKPDRAHWIEFLHQETAVATGTDRYARQYNLGVVFGRINKVKRGYYTLKYEEVCIDSRGKEEGQISRKHSGILENVIQEEPAYWLWTHKRWKHRKPEGVNILR